MMKINFYIIIAIISILFILSCKKRNVDPYVDTTQLSTFSIQSKAANPNVLYGGVMEQLRVIISSKSMKWLINDVAYYLEISTHNGMLLKEDGTPITAETPLYYNDTLLFFETPNVDIESRVSIKLTAKDLKDPVMPGKIVFQETFNFNLETSNLVVVPEFLSQELFIEGTADSATFTIFSNTSHHNDILVSTSTINLTANPAIELIQPIDNQLVENTHEANPDEIERIKQIMGIPEEENIGTMYVSSFTIAFNCLTGVDNHNQIDLKVMSKQSVVEYTDTIKINESPFQFSAVMMPKVFVLQPNVPLPYSIIVDRTKDPKGKAMRNGFKISFESNNTKYFKLYKGNDTLQEKTGIYQSPISLFSKLVDTLYYTQYNGGDGVSDYRKGTTLIFSIQNGATRKTFRPYSVNIYEPKPYVDIKFDNFYATTSISIPDADNMYVSGNAGNLVTRPLANKAYIYIKDENPWALYNVEFYKTNLNGNKTLVEYQIHSNQDPNIVETLNMGDRPIPNMLSIINDGKGFPTNTKFWCTVKAQDGVQNLSDLSGSFLLQYLLYRAYPTWDATYKETEIAEGNPVTVKIFANPN